MTETAAASARALRADEYEARFLRPVEDDEFVPRRREPRPRAYGTRSGGGGAAAGAAVDTRALRVAGGVPGRRTVEIRGQAAPQRRRSSTATAFVARPDRTAMWAFLLALFLVLMAVATAHA